MSQRPHDTAALLRLDDELTAAKLDAAAAREMNAALIERLHQVAAQLGASELMQRQTLQRHEVLVGELQRCVDDLAVRDAERDALLVQITAAVEATRLADERLAEVQFQLDGTRQHEQLLLAEIDAIHGTKVWRLAAFPRRIYGRVRRTLHLR